MVLEQLELVRQVRQELGQGLQEPQVQQGLAQVRQEQEVLLAQLGLVLP